jgi:hypothetical protein
VSGGSSMREQLLSPILTHSVGVEDLSL